MSEQNHKPGSANFRSPWNLVLILAGLVFAGIGAGLVASGFDTASKIIGTGVGIIGLYALALGLRRGVVVDESGITVRRGVRSSKLVPWRDIASLDVEKTDYLLLQLRVPVVSLGNGGTVELQPMAHYHLKSGQDSRYVKRLSELFSEHSRR